MIPAYARVAEDQDINPHRAPMPQSFYRGTIGWKSNDEHHDLGTDSNDGHTFVRVTLHSGLNKNNTEQPEGGVSEGLQVLCQVMGPLHWIPQKGTAVMVAFPEGNISAPGAGVIIGSIGKSPGIQFDHLKPKLDFGPDQTFTVKAGQIILSTYNDDYIALGSAFGIKIGNKEGTGGQIKGTKIIFYSAFLGDAKSVLEIDIDKISIVQKESGFITLEEEHLRTHAQTYTFIGSPMVLLGAVPSSLTPAIHGTPGVPGAPSTGVFISPT